MPPAVQTPRTQLFPALQSALKLHFAPTGPSPVAAHFPPVHLRPPQQSASTAQFWDGPAHAVLHFPVVLPVGIAQTDADSQQSPDEVHVFSAHPDPFDGSQRPRRQLKLAQQSVSAPHAFPSPPQMPRHTFPGRLPVEVQ